MRQNFHALPPHGRGSELIITSLPSSGSLTSRWWRRALPIYHCNEGFGAERSSQVASGNYTLDQTFPRWCGQTRGRSWKEETCFCGGDDGQVKEEEQTSDFVVKSTSISCLWQEVKKKKTVVCVCNLLTRRRQQNVPLNCPGFLGVFFDMWV